MQDGTYDTDVNASFRYRALLIAPCRVSTYAIKVAMQDSLSNTGARRWMAAMLLPLSRLYWLAKAHRLSKRWAAVTRLRAREPIAGIT